MKAAIPILLILLIVVFMLVMMVLPMEGGTMTPGSVHHTDAPTNPYVGAFDTDCEALKNYMIYEEKGVRASWLSECLYHYELQSSGYGLAIVAHPGGQEAAGMHHTVMYRIAHKETEWSVLHQQFTYPKGRDIFVYMGKVAVLAIDYADRPSGTIMISYDRGASWGTELAFHELMDYDVAAYPNLVPTVLNHNVDDGLITFGWKVDPDDADYLLINQFDVHAKAFTEEIQRLPTFPRAPVAEPTETTAEE